MKISDRTLWIVAGLMFLAVVGMAMYKLWPLMNPDVMAVAPLDTGCDLGAGPCTGVLPGGVEISFAIEPRSIPLVQPLQLAVSLKSLSANKVEVDFAGISMNMGFNRSRLQPTSDGSFIGKGVLPVCIRKAMEWEARVLVHTDDGLVAAPFRFITVKNGVPGSEY